MNYPSNKIGERGLNKMHYLGFLNTSIRSCNQGDYIIVESVKRELKNCLTSSFVIELPTHSPVMRPGEFGFRPERNSDYLALKNMEYAFLCGTNLLAGEITSKWNQWNLQEDDLVVLDDKVIAVGVGSAPGFDSLSRRATKLYSSVFSSEYIHSARDERTKNLLESCGLRALNTGCATMWMLTESHCARIPHLKADSVVVTLTDYKKDPVHDSQLIELLLDLYDDVYFWIQGIGDLSYIESLGFSDKVKLVAPNLEAYNALLDSIDCDFVGTRLHAGIKAMQKKKRSIILGVDNRSFDIAQTYGINYVPRDDIDAVRNMVTEPLETHVGINETVIDEFLSQFGGLSIA